MRAETGPGGIVVLYGFGLCWGVMIGIDDCLINNLFASLFGRPHLGEILSIVNGMMMVANSASALLFGAIADAMADVGNINNSTGSNATTTHQPMGSRDGQGAAAGTMGGLAAVFIVLAAGCFWAPTPNPVGKRVPPKPGEE